MTDDYRESRKAQKRDLEDRGWEISEIFPCPTCQQKSWDDLFCTECGGYIGHFDNVEVDPEKCMFCLPQWGSCVFNLAEFDRDEIERAVYRVNRKYFAHLMVAYGEGLARVTHCRDMDYDNLMATIGESLALPVPELSERVKFQPDDG